MGRITNIDNVEIGDILYLVEPSKYWRIKEGTISKVMGFDGDCLIVKILLLKGTLREPFSKTFKHYFWRYRKLTKEEALVELL